MAARIVSLRHRLISASIAPFSQLIQIPSNPRPSIDPPYNTLIRSPSVRISQRSFSWRGGYGRKPEPNATYSFKQEEKQQEEKKVEESGFSVPESETFGQDLASSFDGVENSIAMESASNGIGIGWHTPVDGVIAFIDGLHNLTGLPWWLTLVASTVSIRLAILPVTIFQLKKMDRISEILPKLPPPIPVPGSGISLRQQYALFTQKRRAMGCPTILWNFASIAAQAPCFICSMLAVRWMCLEPHPGFDSGGTFWFVDLTEHAHGTLGAFFPISIAGMHFLIVQMSFQKFKDAKLSGFMASIQKYYKIWLEILTVPIFLTGFYIPQGSLVYWLTNSVWSATQNFCLVHPSFRKKLGLRVQPKEPKPGESIFQPGDGKSMDQLSSDDLLVLAAQHVAERKLDRALQVLRTVLEMDSERSEAYLAMGTIHSKKKLFSEAVELFELAIAKGKTDGVLILAYREVAVALLNQGKNVEAIAHLRKITAFEAPTEPKIRSLYCQGLVMLASILFEDGQKVEAAQYLRLAAKYDPSVNIYLRECEET